MNEKINEMSLKNEMSKMSAQESWPSLKFWYITSARKIMTLIWDSFLQEPIIPFSPSIDSITGINLDTIGKILDGIPISCLQEH